MVELRHLSYFNAVAELGSIAKAATALHMTQPTLSRQIAQLERTLGYELLRRSARGTSLTPAGKGLHEHAKIIFHHVDRIPEVLRVCSEAERTLQVGIPAGIPHAWFSRFEAQLRRLEPRVRLSLHEATSDEQRRLVQIGMIDVGLVHAEPQGIHSALIMSQQFGCCIRDPDVLRDAKTLTFADLTGLRVMAHSAAETPGEEVRLRAAADAAGSDVHWMFRRFSQHGQLIAETSDADAVLVSEASAAKDFTTWRWIPLAESEPNAVIETWAIWSDPDLTDVDVSISAMRHASESAADRSHGFGR
ncbi:LysR family transcriptional regulator [Actinomadura alba]|uniref:LysR family transcriptional regulator n=1 Tax=Actinomadura alba TaxID=406431 RepID=A0ABR7LLU3_9ACTN|nr:LysR family transcriptional regulator [Actinomadura alba]MBC6465788.1 LysR family transcriptional regulator [Actinomadura alba]